MKYRFQYFTLVLIIVCLGFQYAEAQTWDIVSTFDDYETEGWYIFNAPRLGASVVQNTDSTVTITRLEADSSTVYLTHDVQWIEPEDTLVVDDWHFTYEFRVRVDEIGGPNGGTDDHGDRASIYPLKNNEFNETDGHSNGRSWLCSFNNDSIGSRYFLEPNLPKASVDFSDFHVMTFVCKLDYVMLDEKLFEGSAINYGEGYEGDDWPERAIGDHSPWTLYIDRDFDNPVLVDMPGSGWNGWGPDGGVDQDGIIQIGFQGSTKGQITVDFFRTGNEIILDPNGPEIVSIHNWSLY